MQNAVDLLNITKFFQSSNVLANNNVSFSVEQGKVHALVGENGAGKTTLMNILYGLHQPDSGKILVHGQETQINHPDDAIHIGIGMVHQHFKLVPSFTIAENIMLGMESTQLGFLNKKKEAEMVRELAENLGLPVDPFARVKELPVGMQQRVEILKALQRKARILILDEPTAVLTPQEVKELLVVVRNLAERGHTIIFITHKLVEVKAVADKLSVMRNGQMIGTRDVADTSISEMARMMVGRPVLLNLNKKPATPGEVVFSVDNITVADSAALPAVRHFSFDVRAGEILGIAGVSGNGQTELVEAISGMIPIEGGSIKFLGQDISKSSVGDRRNKGMAHVPEDRIHVGLNLETDLDENLVVTQYKKSEFSRRGFLNKEAMQAFASRAIKAFSIASAKPREGIATLSGGNMQKVVLARELSGEPKFVIANQPTRGLDVGSIEFVHRSLIEARDRGAGVLLVSVELEEIISLSDRIIVLYRGEIAGEVDPTTVTEEEIGLLMGGSKLSLNNSPQGKG